MAGGGLTRREPLRWRQNGKATENGRACKFHHQILRRGEITFGIALSWNPVEEELAIPSNGGSPTVRAKWGEEDVMVASEDVKGMLTIKGQDEVLGGTGRPPTPQEAKGRFLGEEVALKATDDLIQTGQRGRGNF